MKNESQKIELIKAYEAGAVEPKWYTFWEEGGMFKADATSSKPAYTISIPPPNVTGALHMGHALGLTLQDILIRWKRMQGYEALWVPGTDHAGIATQTVVERALKKKTGKTRKEHKREEFVGEIWKWKEENESKILNQMKCLGASCDWTRQRFTMDEGCNRAVRKIFKKLYDAGYIYRGDYLVNWDPVTQTALADDEVEYEDRDTFLWHFKYPLKGSEEFIRIATTRPETLLGDTAIAVSPRDARYKHLVGKTVILPLMEREIPIISDISVDAEFGTGMVKVTPAHDPNDYQMGLTHQLPLINIMTPDGKINENGGRFRAMTMMEARAAVVEAMQALNLVEKIEPHTNRVGVSYRSKATIEPYLSKQWFVRMEGFAKTLRSAVSDGRVKLIPENWENTYFHWIDHLRDWCISRQLWWGHRIPIWYNVKNPEIMLCYEGEGVPEEVKNAPEEWRQDDDVLDTWFSSALWPFSILGWPDETPDLKKFYPNSIMITGHDILFFWVARMILMGEYALKKAPFPEAFLTGLIYGKSYWRTHKDGSIHYASEEERKDFDFGKPLPKDVESKWEKMSKTKGNVIDPIEIIKEYGADAMRMALCASATYAREIDLDRRRFEDFKNFANKIWNGARFVFMNLEGDHPLTNEEFSEGLDEHLLSLEDHWILSMLNKTVDEVNNKLSGYLFDQAAMQAYDFFWKEFCAYYLEIAKPVLFGKAGTPEQRKNKQKLLAIILCQSIRLIHPMAPFITEELFQLLKQRLGESKASASADPYTLEAIKALESVACIKAPYPVVVRKSDLNIEINETFALVDRIVYAIRNVRGEMKIPPSTATDVHIVGNANDPNIEIVKKNRTIISALVRSNVIEVHTTAPKIGFTSTGIVDTLTVMIPLPMEMINNEIVRLTKERNKLEYHLEKMRTQLSSEEFVSKAPPALIEQHRANLAQTVKELEEIVGKLNALIHK